jgi:hypothetical protein
MECHSRILAQADILFANLALWQESGAVALDALHGLGFVVCPSWISECTRI